METVCKVHLSNTVQLIQARNWVFSPHNSSLAGCFLQSYFFNSHLFAQVESNRIVSCLNSYIQVSFSGASLIMQIQYFPLRTKSNPFKNCLYTSLFLAKLHQLKIHSQSGIRNSCLWVLSFIRAHMHTKNSPVERVFIWLKTSWCHT